MPQIKIRRESNVVQGHVLDCARAPLLAALRCYDAQLYLRWNPKKRGGMGIWELRRKPELKSVRQSVPSERYGIPSIQGDIYDLGDYSVVVPRYHEYDVENHVKDFEILNYGMVEWVAQHDLWNYGFRGKNAMHEADYKEALYLNKIDEDSSKERDYNVKQHRTLINDFREFVLSGGNPYRLADHWGQK